MDQRTCNIIMCCKGACRLEGGNNKPPLVAVAAYMSHECGCPQEDYKGNLMERIMSEALCDYLEGTDRPGHELRRLFNQSVLREPPMSERIATLFQLTSLRGGDDLHLVNGFTEELLEQSKKDLSEDNKEEKEND